MAKQSSKRSFRYQERSKDDIKERANSRGGNFDTYILPKYKLYKVRDGKNIVRILPPTWEKAKHYGYDIWVNWGIGVDNQSYLSLAEMKGEKDPLAEARREAMKDGDKELAKALQPRQRILMWVIDRLDEDEGPQLWAAPQTVDKDIATLCFDVDTKEVLYIDDPEKGQDFRFYKEGQGLKTKYNAAQMKLLTAGPIHEDEELQNEWLDYIEKNPIPECLQFYDYDHIASAFGGQARVDRDDDEDKPKARRRLRDDDEDENKPARRKPAAEADDDEDDEPPFDTKKTSRSSSRSRLSDDDEDEKPAKRKVVDEDDDEAEKPARRRAAKADEDDDEDADEAPKESIRDRLKRRRSAATKSDDEDDD